MVNIEKLKGYRVGNNIWLAQGPNLSVVDTYYHEVGHVIGGAMSFRGDSVMTPDDVKRFALEAQKEDLQKITELLLSRTDGLQDVDAEFLLTFANEIIRLFTKGRFFPDVLQVWYNVTPHELTQVILANNGAETLDVRDGDFKFVDSNLGRDIELPAFITQVACMRMTENTLRTIEPNLKISLGKPSSPAHMRAFKIAQRAYASPGWTLPSLRDLEDR